MSSTVSLKLANLSKQTVIFSKITESSLRVKELIRSLRISSAELDWIWVECHWWINKSKAHGFSSRKGLGRCINGLDGLGNSLGRGRNRLGIAVNAKYIIPPYLFPL